MTAPVPKLSRLYPKPDSAGLEPPSALVNEFHPAQMVVGPALQSGTTGLNSSADAEPAIQSEITHAVSVFKDLLLIAQIHS
jgi:hypothetical protein